MTSKKYLSGSVFQFYIQQINKYAFCQFYDFTHLSDRGILARSFDKFSDVEENDLSYLSDADWLFGHRIVCRWPFFRKGGSWKFLGVLLNEGLEFVPDFKGSLAFPPYVEDESTIDTWFPVFNLNKWGEPCPYEQVQHLEYDVRDSPSGLQLRTGLEYCRLHQLDVKKHFTHKIQDRKPHLFHMNNVPMYKDIPKEKRGRASVANRIQ